MKYEAQYRPQREPPRRELARPVEKSEDNHNYAKHFGPPPRIGDQYTRKARMGLPVLRRRGKKRGEKLRYRSHYGSNSEHLDTRTKSYMLYNHCFG